MTLSAAVKRLIKTKGKSLILIKKTVGAYTPGTGVAAGSEKEIEITGKFIQIRDSLHEGSSLTVAGMKKAIIPAKGLFGSQIPDEEDEIRDGTKTYKIMDVAQVTEGEDVIAYMCMVKV